MSGNSCRFNFSYADATRRITAIENNARGANSSVIATNVAITVDESVIARRPAPSMATVSISSVVSPSRLVRGPISASMEGA